MFKSTRSYINLRSTLMWNLTSYDINRIKGQLQARKARIEAKYAEETKAVDADFADLETLERVAAVLALKYKADEPADASEEAAETRRYRSCPMRPNRDVHPERRDVRAATPTRDRETEDTRAAVRARARGCARASVASRVDRD